MGFGFSFWGRRNYMGFNETPYFKESTMPNIDLTKIKDGVKELASSDAAKLVASVVVTTGALVATHLVIKQIEKGADAE